MGPSGRLSPTTSARAENVFKVFITVSVKYLYPARSMGELKKDGRGRAAVAAGKKENNRRRPVAGVSPFRFRALLLLRGGGVFLVECLYEFRHLLNHRPGGVNVAD